MNIIDDIKRDREAGTPGPWGWEVNKTCHTVELCGGKRASDLTVMSFVRWGMQRAAPEFWFWKGNVSDEPKRADAVSVPAPAREHHEAWFRRIDHPDARRIARVPDLEAALMEAVEALETIKGQHVPDQPAALNIDEADYILRCHTELRRIATAALSRMGSKSDG